MRVMRARRRRIEEMWGVVGGGFVTVLECTLRHAGFVSLPRGGETPRNSIQTTLSLSWPNFFVPLPLFGVVFFALFGVACLLCGGAMNL
ncbi:hypothetical protein C8R46DRAFT_46885 [Mycena filopes]|nr:hypothetical protein C8R46DRAFT_46885 [Mycena filopes]